MRDTFEGKYSDGHSAVDHDVLVRFLPTGLELTLTGEDRSLNWPYRQLTHSGPLLETKNTQLGSKESPGARLFVPDPEFASQLVSRAPHLSKRARNRKLVYPLLAIGAFVFILIIGMWVSGFSTARSIALMMPDTARGQLGDLIVSQIIADRKICSETQGQQAFDKMTRRLTLALNTTKEYKIVVAKLGIVNAFAAPGERIIVSDGLIRFVDSPEELAGIIAHEMGHGLALHPEIGIIRAIGFSAALQIVLGSSSGGLGDIGVLLLQLQNTRRAETEADDHALAIMREAKIDPGKMADFFNRVRVRSNEPEAGENGDTNIVDSARSLFSTHPGSKNRAKKFASARSSGAVPILNQAEWQSLRGICS